MTVVLAALSLAGCGKGDEATREVVVYTSVDQVYAKEVFDLFTERTGIRVLPVFDTESQKTTGLFRRLLAERDRPRADVFWNGEVCRTIQLAGEGIAAPIEDCVPQDFPSRWVDPEGRWVALSLRARVLVYNKDLVDESTLPETLDALTKPPWQKKYAMANPVFGTSATHVAALYEKLGEEKADALVTALKANAARVVEGNSVVRDLVARGDVPLGLTDSDDFFAGQIDGAPIGAIPLDRKGAGAFVIPNSVMIVKGAAHPEAARAFVRFLLDGEVERLLAFGRCRQLPVCADVERPADLALFDNVEPMDVDYRDVAARMEKTSRRMDEIFGM